MIPAAARDAFGLRGHGTHLAGGVNGVFRFGDVVVKEVIDAAEAEWEQRALADLPPAEDVRWPRPIATRDGRWVVDGWIADEFVPGLRPVAPDWRAVIDAGNRFHRVVAHLRPPSELLARRTHRWARGERHAFDEGVVSLPEAARRLDGELAARCAPETAPTQFVHVDLTGNVFTDARGLPVVLDVAVGARTSGYAAAVVVADALVWHGAGLDLVDALGPGTDVRSHIARALRFRLVTDVIAARETAGTQHITFDTSRYVGVVAATSGSGPSSRRDAGSRLEPGAPGHRP